MDIQDIIDPDRIAFDLDATSKKRALEKISEILAQDQTTHLVSNDVCESLIAREKHLGS